MSEADKAKVSVENIGKGDPSSLPPVSLQGNNSGSLTSIKTASRDENLYRPEQSGHIETAVLPTETTEKRGS